MINNTEFKKGDKIILIATVDKDFGLVQGKIGTVASDIRGFNGGIEIAFDNWYKGHSGTFSDDNHHNKWWVDSSRLRLLNNIILEDD